MIKVKIFLVEMSIYFQNLSFYSSGLRDDSFEMRFWNIFYYQTFSTDCSFADDHLAIQAMVTMCIETFQCS